jgi:sugar/nucleoside kinase (ribokinase family)
MTTTRYDILALGNAIVDVLAFADDKYIDAEGMAKGCMMLIDEQRAKKIQGDMNSHAEVPGGSAANTLVAMADLGARVAFIGKVRDDALGESYKRGMQDVGVYFPTPAQCHGPATACCYILVTPDGQRTMNTFLGVCSDVTEADVDEEAVAQSAIVYVEGYLWDQPAAKAALRKAISVAKANNRKIALSLSDLFCVERHRAEFFELISDHVDILFANEMEITALCQTQNFDECVEMMRGRVGLAVLTRSEKGSVLVSEKETVKVDVYPARAVVDTTGAGDLYAAGVLYGLAQNWALADCGALGAKLAAHIIAQVGARSEHTLKPLLAAQAA